MFNLSKFVTISVMSAIISFSAIASNELRFEASASPASGIGSGVVGDTAPESLFSYDYNTDSFLTGKYTFKTSSSRGCTTYILNDNQIRIGNTYGCSKELWDTETNSAVAIPVLAGDDFDISFTASVSLNTTSNSRVDLSSNMFIYTNNRQHYSYSPVGSR